MNAFNWAFSVNNAAWILFGMAYSDGRQCEAGALCAIGCFACLGACYLYYNKGNKS